MTKLADSTLCSCARLHACLLAAPRLRRTARLHADSKGALSCCSKAFLIEYERGLRVVIFSANAIYPDCNNKSQVRRWSECRASDEAAGVHPPVENGRG